MSRLGLAEHSRREMAGQDGDTVPDVRILQDLGGDIQK